MVGHTGLTGLLVLVTVELEEVTEAELALALVLHTMVQVVMDLPLRLRTASYQILVSLINLVCSFFNDVIEFSSDFDSYMYHEFFL